MQTAALLKATIQGVERICPRFLWGKLEGERCLHTVNWANVCTPKHFGKLGLPKLQAINKGAAVEVGVDGDH